LKPIYTYFTQDILELKLPKDMKVKSQEERTEKEAQYKELMGKFANQEMLFFYAPKKIIKPTYIKIKEGETASGLKTKEIKPSELMIVDMQKYRDRISLVLKEETGIKEIDGECLEILAVEYYKLLLNEIVNTNRMETPLVSYMNGIRKRKGLESITEDMETEYNYEEFGPDTTLKESLIPSGEEDNSNKRAREKRFGYNIFYRVAHLGPVYPKFFYEPRYETTLKPLIINEDSNTEFYKHYFHFVWWEILKCMCPKLTGALFDQTLERLIGNAKTPSIQMHKKERQREELYTWLLVRDIKAVQNNLKKQGIAQKLIQGSKHISPSNIDWLQQEVHYKSKTLVGAFIINPNRF